MTASDVLLGVSVFSLMVMASMAVFGIPVWRALVMTVAIWALALSLHHLARDRPFANVSRETVAK